jgi:PAS domain S-box-containing protein
MNRLFKRVLIAAKNAKLFEQAARSLQQERHDFEPVAEANPGEALERMASNRYDAYVVDADFGETGGARLVAEARRRGCTGPVLMLLESGSEEALTGAIKRGIEAGVDDFVKKNARMNCSLGPRMAAALNMPTRSETLARQDGSHGASAPFRGKANAARTLYFHSGGAEELLALPSGSFGAVTYREYIHEDDLNAVCCEVLKAVTEGRSYSLEYRICDAAGQRKWVFEQGWPSATMPGGVEGCITDVTARKNVEQQLREREELMQVLVEAMPDFVCFKDHEGRWQFANDAALSVFGLNECEYLGKRDCELAELREYYREAFLACAQGDEEAWASTDVSFSEEMIPSEDGRPRHFDVFKVPLFHEDGRRRGLVVYARNVTERVRAQKEIARLARAVEQASESVVITDKNGTIEYVNPAFEKVSGYSRSEAIGNTPRVIKSGRHPNSFYADIWETIYSGETWAGRIVNRRKDGAFFQEEGAISPLRDEAGNIDSFVSVKRDISHQAVYDERMQQAQRLEAIGSVAGGIAHDFNNILNAIAGYSALLESCLYGLNGRDYVSGMNDAVKRGSQLVRQVVSFSRRVEQGAQEFAVAPVVREALNLVRAGIRRKVDIIEAIDENAGAVAGQPTQIHQIVMNLCTNAVHAMQGRDGVVTVGLRRLTAEPPLARRQAAIEAGHEYLVITVEDEGTGMDAETLLHIFDPFFTTKVNGEGTGLGLATVRALTDALKGDVVVESAKGKGTKFSVYLPAVEKVEKFVDGQISSLDNPPAVLVVDDEKPLVRVTKRLIESLGYTAFTTSECDEALEWLREDPGRFQVLVSDYSMPKMNGLELIDQVRQFAPDLPILIATGFVEKLPRWKVEEARVLKVIQKPYSREELADALSNALSSSIEENGPAASLN